MSLADSAVSDTRRSTTSFLTRAVFIAVISLSAFLLFLIQPMFSKMAIPLVGGAPGVWTTAMLFFQSILLAGYAYAHWLASSFSVSGQRQIHLTVTAIATLALPLALPLGWAMPQDGNVTLWLLMLFAVSIGAPFFALSANSPLIQHWYSNSGNDDAGDPYFLYAASNIGSFGALAAYPLLIEPSVGLAAQGRLWTLGYLVLMFGIVAAGLMARDRPKTQTATAERSDVAPLTTRQVLYWMLLAFVPSSIMLSVTAKIATDLGSFPLIWVTTLGLYLLTYVFAFSERFRQRSAWLPKAHMLLAIGMVLMFAFDTSAAQQSYEIFLLLGFLFITALTFHTRLARSRPDERQLTGFFLAMSAGGALGGLFNSVLAPMMFNNVHEYPVALALAFLVAPVARRETLRDLWPAVAVGLAVLAGVTLARGEILGDLAPALRTLPLNAMIALAALALLKWAGMPLRQTATAAGILGALSLGGSDPSLMLRERSFFGVYEVHDVPEQNIRFLKHATTLHGMMRTDLDFPKPAAYYVKSGPFGQYFDLLEAGKNVGIVGLGAGGLACQRVGEIEQVFYEIDPLVDRIARDTRYFNLLARCAPDAPTIVGDARIELEKAPAGAHDHLVLDAFSSDAIPAHLLTREAFQTYDRILPEDGSIFVHISNRHFALEGPITKVAQSLGFEVFFQQYVPSAEEKAEDKASLVHALVITRDAQMMEKLAAQGTWRAAQPWDRAIWTDDYADTLSAWK